MDVIKNAVERTCRKHGIAFAEAEGRRFCDAVPTWQFVAAFDLGRDEGPLDRDRAGALGAGSFRVPYVVCAVTPGRFVQPGTVVQDMYRPDVTARMAARGTEVAPR